MCNAWNHSPGCMCGWGGDGHLGRSPAGWHDGYAPQGVATPRPLPAYRAFSERRFGWRYDDEDWCAQISCQRCGAPVYLVHYNGGYASFDSLGKPWPKHPCYDTLRSPALSSPSGASSAVHPVSGFKIDPQQLEFFSTLDNLLVGLITQVEYRRKSKTDRVVIRWPDQEAYSTYIPQEMAAKKSFSLHHLIGEIVAVSKAEQKMACLGLKVSTTLHDEPKYIVGEWYTHSTFGVGKLIDVSKVEGDYRLVVSFRKVGSKILTASFARLTQN